MKGQRCDGDPLSCGCGVAVFLVLASLGIAVSARLIRWGFGLE